MPGKISLKPVLKSFNLETVEGARITVRQARTGDIRDIAGLFAEQTQEWTEADLGKISMKRKWNMEELRQERVFRTLVGFDIEDEDTGSPLFRFKEGQFGPEMDMTARRFAEVWGALPVAVSEEIYKRVIEVNPTWDPDRAGE